MIMNKDENLTCIVLKPGVERPGDSMFRLFSAGFFKSKKPALNW